MTLQSLRLAAITGLAIMFFGGGVAFAHGDDEDGVEHLMQLDREFSDTSKRLGTAAAWAAYVGDYAVQLNDGAQPIIGLANILVTMVDQAEDTSLTWTPLGGGISSSEDLGFTWGRWLYEAPGETGELSQSHGKYISIWKKQADGGWKIILDGGNSNPPPAD